MANDNERADDSVAWDRVGQFLQNAGTVGQGVWTRNLRLWNDVSRRIREERYTPDAMADDATRAMVAAIENLDDIWSFWTRPQERERVAAALPTAFLFFDRRDPKTEHSLVDPVLIRIPPGEAQGLPANAEVTLGGSPEEGVAALLACLNVRLVSQGYQIETHNESGNVRNLHPGAYDGFVYVSDPPRPLASLRIVVEGPPPKV